MDLKSIVLNKRMKFFHNITLISSCLFLNWAYPYDVQDIPEPFHQLSYQYSKLHNQQPKNAYPNTAYLNWEIPAVTFLMSDLSASLPKHLYSKMEETQHAYGHDPCLQLLLIYEHFQNYIFGLVNRDIDFEHRLAKQHIGILLPIQYGNSNWLSNVNSCDSLAFYKTKTFIETKVTAIKLQSFNL